MASRGNVALLGKLIHGHLQTACLHGDILPKTRRENFTKFTSGEKSILVTSDVAFRGLDFPTKTRVVMFDFPLNPCDFLHRAGRTARAGSTGVVVAFVSKRNDRRFAVFHRII